MKKYVLLLCCICLLSGCWDQNLLKDVQLVYTVGYDVLEDGSEQTTSVAPPVDEAIEEVNVLSTNENTVRDSRYHIDTLVAEHIDFSKLQVMILGNDLARDQIYPYIDVVYRDPKHHLNARMAMTDTSAKELLEQPIESQKNKSEYFAGLLESSEIINVIPKMTLQQACTILLDPGKDLFMPILIYREDLKRVEAVGTSLFSKDRYVDVYLDHDQSTLFNILRNETPRILRLTKKFSEDEQPEVSNWMTIEMKDSKTNLKFKENPFSLSVEVKLKGAIAEYGPDHLVGAEKLKSVEAWWEKTIKEDTEALFMILQENQSDILGIGRMTAALAPEEWDKDEWHQKFSELPIEVTVDMSLSSTGIID
ncbi:Ger(x)C family spore germination protein [Jeotgalibacillus haloalkalitolerans]|uniref:Ger(X)C family spore germination protein n=1 Tax=Jeotgalibacillus haloalkalitolerans TaxID=3104292 RepID=A0ABU5KMF8_9BACL|nr:Ger(x)C family spore germination protein [Jeotgalibacillus sp. HH7-29]MDZ5711931.1 Ger(x)C family spore germination protein [Jeotgalibacillus sp. HH7-29]